MTTTIARRTAGTLVVLAVLLAWSSSALASPGTAPRPALPGAPAPLGPAIGTGIPAPTIKLPYAFALAAGVCDTVFTGKLRGKEPRVTIDAVRMGRKKMWVSSAEAERELGYRIVPVDAALRRACEWFRANGYA